MIKTDLRRYSDEAQKEWIETPAVFTEKALLIKGYQVMQRWEDSYMKSLAAIAASRGGNILEVGFGLGISAKYIQRAKSISLHTVIECHLAVVESAKRMFSESINKERMKITHAFWEDVIPEMPDESFDGILFDSCPLESNVELFQFFPFFTEAYRLLKKGGIFTYFSDEATNISANHKNLLEKAGFKSKNIRYKICKVKPPKECEYWKHNTIVSPILTR